ncbi:unnamed protein product [Moneuplotes crassus]|uniref:Uncharacterized protein n=1 Tax=Euplotes crassus TaxID=5936 RepID=A0AAD1UDZ8_EUPCR|nr:unnamed protein product [Moneuplotes crassus]
MAQEEYQTMSLCISFLFILVLIPLGFFYWYSNSYTCTGTGLKEDDRRRYAQVLNEMMSFQDFLKVQNLQHRADQENPMLKRESCERKRLRFGGNKATCGINAPVCFVLYMKGIRNCTRLFKRF